MSEYGPTHNEIDDYIAELPEAEREGLATADTATELAFLFHDARETRGLTQAEAAKLANIRQQAVSRFEQPDMKLANTKIETLRKYMAALNFVVQITVADAKSGALVKRISLPPAQDWMASRSQASSVIVDVPSSPAATVAYDKEVNRDERVRGASPDNDWRSLVSTVVQPTAA